MNQVPNNQKKESPSCVISKRGGFREKRDIGVITNRNGNISARAEREKILRMEYEKDVNRLTYENTRLDLELQLQRTRYLELKFEKNKEIEEWKNYLNCANKNAMIMDREFDEEREEWKEEREEWKQKGEYMDENLEEIKDQITKLNEEIITTKISHLLEIRKLNSIISKLQRNQKKT